MDFKITNIEKQHKDKIHKLIEKINREDNLNYSLTKDMHKASLLVAGENERALGLYRKIGFKEVDIDLIMTKIV